MEKPNKYNLVADGGKQLDKRTWQGKALIERIKDRDAVIATDEDIPAHYGMLRIKDIEQLFTTDNLILS